MSQEITEARVQQYSDNVMHLSQQKGSRLRGKVRLETVRGKVAFFDRLGLAQAQLRTTRHADTPQIDTPHSRRMVPLADYEYGDLIDQPDKIRMIWDPTGPYTTAAVWSLGRSMDDVILDAFSGTAVTGETGSGTVTLPNSQKLASVSGGAGAKLNVDALRATKRILDGNDVDDSIRRYIAHNALQMESLLGQTETTSADFNTVRALSDGRLNSFLGFEFVRTEQTNNQAGTLAFNQTTGAVGAGAGDADLYDKVIAWAEDGQILGVGMDINARVAERADKSFSVQVYASQSIGSVRMEEEKVVEILCALT